MENTKILHSNVPDETVSLNDMHEYGYHWDGMYPLEKEAALKYYDFDFLQIYKLYNDGTESAVVDEEDLKGFDGLFGIEKEFWNSRKF